MAQSRKNFNVAILVIHISEIGEDEDEDGFNNSKLET
jgi:hypothetical protein